MGQARRQRIARRWAARRLRGRPRRRPGGGSGGGGRGGFGGWGGGSSGWGGGSGGGGGGGRRGPNLPPDFDALIARLQAWLRGRGRGPSGGWNSPRMLGLAAVGVVALWLASGFYVVQPDQLGVVMRFGAFTGTTPPGLNYHLPWPIEFGAAAAGHAGQSYRRRLSRA